MRKLLGLLTISSICLALSIATTGCSPPKKGTEKTDKFTADPAAVSLDGKDKSAGISFKHGEPASAESADKALVSAEKKEKKVVVKQLADGGKEDKKVEVTVMGGKEGKEKAVITVTIKKAASPPPPDKFVADPDAVILVKKGDKTEVGFKHGDPKEAKSENDKLVAATVDGKKLKLEQIDVGGVDDEKVKVKVMGGKEGKDEAWVTVTVKKKEAVVKKPVDPVEDIELTEKKDAKGEVTIDKAKDVVWVVKVAKGKIDSVTVDPADKGVTAKVDEGSVKVTVAKDAKAGDYKIEIKAKGEKAKGATLELKVKAPVDADVGQLNDRQRDLRVFNSIREFPLINQERFVVLNRRM